MNEGALRLLPLVSGIGILVLIWLVARKLYGSAVAVLATLYCASSPSLVNASAEVKQYTFEALVACVLVHASVSWLELPTSKQRGLVLLFAGLAGVWLTPTAAFVLVGMVLLVASQSTRSHLKARATLAACILLWAGSALCAYQILYVEAAESTYLRRYWAPALLTPGRPGVLIDMGYALRALVWSPVWRDSFGTATSITWAVPIGVCLILIGLLGVRRAARESGVSAALLLVAPPVALVLASTLGLYPLSGRTTMFFLPVGLTLIAAGLSDAVAHIRGVWLARAIRLAPAVMFLWLGITDLVSPHIREDVSPLVRRWSSERKPGEPIYVLAGAIPAWTFYSTDWLAPDWRRLRQLEEIGSSDGPAFENASRWTPRDRVEMLRYDGVDGMEIYGVPTGLEAQAFGLLKASPDSGWATSEAQRIRSAAGSVGIWLLLSHYYGPEGRLLDALQGSGGTMTFRDERNSAALLHYAFP